MRKEIDIKNEMATQEGFDNWEQLRKDFIGKGLHGTVAAYEAKAAKIFSSNSVLSDSLATCQRCHKPKPSDRYLMCPSCYGDF